MPNSENNTPKKRKWFAGSPVFYIVAGIYLCYLGYKLIRDVMDNGDISSQWYFTIAGGIFIIGGLWAVYYGYTVNKKHKQQKADEEAAAIAAEQEVSHEDYIQSSSSGIGYVADDDSAEQGYITDSAEDEADSPEDEADYPEDEAEDDK